MSSEDFSQILAKTDVEMQRLGWTQEQGRGWEHLIINLQEAIAYFADRCGIARIPPIPSISARPISGILISH